MYAVKTFKGAQLDLTHFKGATIRDYEIEFLNDDCTAMELGLYSNIIINIRYKEGGTLINSYSALDGEITFNNPKDQFIYWTVESEDFEEIPRLEYFQECFGVLSNGQKDLLFHGISDLT